ncbi:putative transposon, En/Spm-like protein, partial [Tanacetum coccineum]
MGNVDSFQLHNGGKPCWFDCHRRFLPARHPYRRDRKGFLAQKSVFAGPPPQLTGTEIWQQIRHLPTVYEGEPYRPKNKKIDGFGQTHNWVKRSIFWELPYWHTLLIRHNLDLMHIEKNFFENLFHTIMGSLKTKDNVKARKDVELYCDRPELHMFKVQNRDMKPKASYTLNKTQLHKVCEWMTKLKFPDGEALLGGPKQYRWMYIYERKLGSLKRTVRNKARVEGSIVESYLINELSMHCSLYFDPRIETRLNREPRNFAPDIHCSSRADSRLNIFKVPSRRLFDTGTKRFLTSAEKHKAHTYILLNCEDVHPFL